MKFVELKKAVQKRRDACYVLSGDDPFVVSSAVKFFERMCDLPEMNLVRLTAPTASDIVAAAVVFPVMSPVRVVVVEEFDKDASALVDYLASPSDMSVVVIVSPTLGKNLGGVIGKATVVDCSRQDGSMITAYIARECAAAGTSITTSAAKTLCDRCNCYMSRVSVELQKLVAYRNGGVIEESDVVALVGADPEYKVYELGDSIASRKGEKALGILYDMLRGGNAAGVFGMIYSHFRKLLYVAVTSSDEEIKKCLKVADYPLRKLREQARNFTPKRLKRICDELHKVDSDYKAGLIGDKLAITTFATHVVNEGR